MGYRNQSGSTDDTTQGGAFQNLDPGSRQSGAGSTPSGTPSSGGGSGSASDATITLAGDITSVSFSLDQSTDESLNIQLGSGVVTATELATNAVTDAKIQTAAVTAAKIAGNAVGADALNVAGNGTSGQVLSSDGDGSFSWVANSGGGAQIPSEHARITLNHTQFTQNSTGDTVVTGTITVDSPYSYVGTGTTNGTGGISTLACRDAAGNVIGITQSELSSATFTFTVTAANKQTVQNIRVSGTVYATYQSVVHSAPVSATVRIVAPAPAVPDWYVFQGTAAPTNNAAMTNRGDFSSGVSNTFTIANSGGRMGYISLPTRSGGYTFTSGAYFLTANTASFGGTQAGYTLYQLPDLSDAAGAAGTITVTVREA